MAILLQDVCTHLEQLAPLPLAARWDNTGLLVGDHGRTVERVMLCLTVTDDVVREAIHESAELLVTHHPLPFRPLNSLTTSSTVGRRLLQLIEAKVAVYSLHTRWDSAQSGINQQWAEMLELQEIQPLIDRPDNPIGPCGSGRCGRLPAPQPAWRVVQSVLTRLQLAGASFAGPLDRQVERVALACGAGDDFLYPAIEADCQLLVTGEARFHTAVEAELNGIGLLAIGHYASERWGVERLAEVLQQAFPQLEIWASRLEHDSWQPVQRQATDNREEPPLLE
ncbi:MAG: GTP cyclohydrolase 1 type 2 [Pirellulaceae bacterium]|nr:MAG: GTP cyclohydrolase 1 type 2 [Pirellulaceae bacterium]